MTWNKLVRGVIHDGLKKSMAQISKELKDMLVVLLPDHTGEQIEEMISLIEIQKRSRSAYTKILRIFIDYNSKQRTQANAFELTKHILRTDFYIKL